MWFCADVFPKGGRCERIFNLWPLCSCLFSLSTYLCLVNYIFGYTQYQYILFWNCWYQYQFFLMKVLLLCMIFFPKLWRKTFFQDLSFQFWKIWPKTIGSITIRVSVWYLFNFQIISFSINFYISVIPGQEGYCHCLQHVCASACLSPCLSCPLLGNYS